MNKKPYTKAYVNKDGYIVLPPYVAKQYGLMPGAEFDIREGAFDLSVRSPLSHLSTVYVEPTNYCNLECRTCMRNSWDEPLGRMDIQTFDRIIEGVRTTGAVKIFFGGFGEPLAHPQIIDMVSKAHATGAKVELITNGTLLTQAMSTDLINAGLDMLWVSLDGAKPESYADVRLGAALPEIVENLKQFVNIRRPSPHVLFFPDPIARPQIGIVFVAMKRNIGDLPAVIRMGMTLGATRFIVTNVLPYTPEMRNEILYYDAVGEPAFQPSPYITEIPKFDISKITTKPFIEALYAGTGIKFAGGDLAESTDRCPFMEKRALAVAWDGYVVPCLPLLHDHTSYLNGRERFSKRHAVGTLQERSLDDIWRDPTYMAFRKTVDEFDFSPCAYCGGCDLSLTTDEDCYGNTFPTCGGCLWAQGIIQCP
jgi:MoaA/NifB/PqqE/SkfB family radical SAM enzyme